jgi:hypothetical protein
MNPFRYKITLSCGATFYGVKVKNELGDKNFDNTPISLAMTTSRV